MFGAVCSDSELHRSPPGHGAPDREAVSGVKRHPGRPRLWPPWARPWCLPLLHHIILWHLYHLLRQHIEKFAISTRKGTAVSRLWNFWFIFIFMFIFCKKAFYFGKEGSSFYAHPSSITWEASFERILTLKLSLKYKAYRPTCKLYTPISVPASSRYITY